jgi:hypothetical protein
MYECTLFGSVESATTCIVLVLDRWSVEGAWLEVASHRPGTYAACFMLMMVLSCLAGAARITNGLNPSSVT